MVYIIYCDEFWKFSDKDNEEESFEYYPCVINGAPSMIYISGDFTMIMGKIPHRDVLGEDLLRNKINKHIIILGDVDQAISRIESVMLEQRKMLELLLC